MNWLKKKSPPQGGIGLCLNSCYFGFFAHTGFLLELHRSGLPLRHVSGCSAGALVAGAYAGGIAPERLAHLVLRPDLWQYFLEWQLPWNLGRLLLNRPQASGILNGHRLKGLLAKELEARHIEDCAHPRLSIAACNMTHTRQQLLEQGPIADAIMASLAVPGMFQAQDFAGDLYWDGGIGDPLPVECFLDDPEVRVVILHVARNGRAQSKGRRSPQALRFWSAIRRTPDIMESELIRLKIELLIAAGKEVWLFETRTPKSGPHRLHLGPANLMRGRQTFVRQCAPVLQRHGLLAAAR
ncbi:MAG: patatin-like phospholipase family protein [Leptospiraceae bacterium]|nr:patatin-like phospholipase family protein [Leptospiraceae bacterium]